jgi:hypothetical protein
MDIIDNMKNSIQTRMLSFILPIKAVFLERSVVENEKEVVS